MPNVSVYPDFPQVKAVLPTWGDIGDIVSRGTAAGYGLGQIFKGVPQTEADLANQFTAGKLAAQPLERRALEIETSLAPLIAQAKYMAALTDANKPIIAPAGSGILRPGADSPFYQQPNKLTRSRLQFVGTDKASGRPINYDPDLGEYSLGDLPAGASAIAPRTLPQPTVIEGTVDNQPALVSVQPQIGGGAVGSPITSSGGTGTVGPKKETVPEKIQGELQGGLGALKDIEKLEAGVSETGRLKGLWTTVQIFAGEEFPNVIGENQKGIDFQTARNDLKLEAQALIKGIPSNFDVQTLINTLPDLTLPQSVNKSRIESTKRKTKSLISNIISYYKGTKQQIPENIISQARLAGVNVDSALPWDGQGDPLNRGEVASGTPGAVERWIRGPNGQITKAQ